MIERLKKNLDTLFKKSLQTLVLCITVTFYAVAQQQPTSNDTIKEIKTITKDSIINKETSEIALDSTQTDSLVKKKTFLDDNVVYSAKDYMRLNRKNGKMYLYDNAKIKYTDLDIESGSIVVHQTKKEVYAKGIKDTANAYTQTPIFTQGSNVVEPDTIRFNFASKKALIYNSKTSQEGFNIVNEVSKRENDSVVYMKNVKFTTSQNLEDPEYYFYARRIKFVPKKKIVTGLVNMYIADVPTPLGLPFGYFPMKQEAVSGFIIPSFNQSDQQGFQFQNGGYYFAINDRVDLTLTGDYSTNSSYALRADSRYSKRYKYSGNLSARFENNITGERGFEGFGERSNYNLRWSHRRASKANPNSNFTANVNFGSSQFFRQSRNQTNIGSQLTNTLSSNISYSRSFPIEPKIDFQTALNIRQNSNTQVVNINTPTSINTGRVFPFAPKSGIKKGILQNINLQARSRITNQVETSEDDLFSKETLRNARQGVQTNIPISTNFKIFKYLSASASTSFTENWVFETIKRSFDEDGDDGRGQVVNDTIKGFDAYRTYDFSTSVGTSLYGTVQFKKEAKIKAIRHVVRPSVGYSYRPSFDQFYDEYIVPADVDRNRPEERVSFTRFQGGILGQPSNRESSSLNISLNNTLEIKVADKDTTKVDPKIVKVLNSLNFTTSYNFKADSLKLRPIAVSGSIPVVKKLTLNFGGTLDPYALNNNNVPINKLNIKNGGSLFRLTRANLNFGYSFSSEDFKRKKKKDDETVDQDDYDNETLRNGGRPDDLFGSHTNLNDGRLFDEDSEEDKEDKLHKKFYNHVIPWSLRLSYAINYSNARRQDQISSHAINFSGDVEIAPRWRIGASSGYDVLKKDFTYTNLRFQRDLESWTMSFNWVPFSELSSWNFFIGISSSVLSDIKWDKRRQPDQTVN